VDSDESEEKAIIGDSAKFYDKIAEAFSGKTVVDDKPMTDEWGTYYSAYAPIYNSANKIVAIVGVDYPIDKVNEQLAYLLELIIMISLICVVITVLGAVLISRSIGRNLRMVNQKIIDVVHSDGDLTKTIEIHSGDELETMANNLNEFFEQTRKIILKITEATTNIHASSDVIDTNMNEANDKISNVAATMQEMSASMEDTSGKVEKMYQFSEISYEAFEKINTNILQGSSLVDSINQKASDLKKEAAKVQQDTRSKVIEINRSLNEKIEQSRAVEHINELTENILGITKQTNLLALNASIEAARAGQEGKGFAVVASQIGKLAEDSSQTATKIKEISATVIRTVDELSLVATDMLDYINTSIMKDYDKLVYTGEQYNDDAQSVQIIINGFKAEVKNLHTAMHEIRKSLRAVNEIVDGNTKEIQNVSMNVNAIDENVRDIKRKAHDNSTSTQNLEQVVGHFKVTDR
jgi:methyl-accepting chemotaxis protein